jgi:FdhD protein
MGWVLLQGMLPLEQHMVLVSGRASFELVQKALVARVPLFCAISAPSSLAVDLARRFGMTLVGFLREDSFNIYCGQDRITR